MSFRGWFTDIISEKSSSDKDDQDIREKLESIESKVDGLTEKVDRIENKVSNSQDDSSRQGSVDHGSPRNDGMDAKDRKDYRDPILVSLYELGEDQYWQPEEIQDNWKGKYLELNDADLSEEEAGLGKRKVYKNRHAWALVDLQRDNLIKKNGDKKQYQITDKGIKYLKKEDLVEEDLELTPEVAEKLRRRVKEYEEGDLKGYTLEELD